MANMRRFLVIVILFFNFVIFSAEDEEALLKPGDLDASKKHPRLTVDTELANRSYLARPDPFFRPARVGKRARGFEDEDPEDKDFAVLLLKDCCSAICSCLGSCCGGIGVAIKAFIRQKPSRRKRVPSKPL